MSGSSSASRRLRARPRARVAVGVALLGAAFGCAGQAERAAHARRRTPLTAEAALSEPYGSPSRLLYHPRHKARTLAQRTLPQGAELLVGERGERWLLDAGRAKLSSGAMLAPEPLIATLLGEGGAYWFVGASGTSYFARGPLQAFERASAPVEALTAVSAAGSAVLGVRQQRSLLRSADFGVSWAPSGPPSVAFVDVALAGSGVGLALAVPEALYRTADFGATWQPLDVPPLGALEVEVALDGRLLALTPLGDYGWDDAKRAFERPGRAGAARDLPTPPRGPDAGALAEGRAVLASGSYLELMKPAARDAWQLLYGPIGGPLEAQSVPESAGCRAVRLGAFRNFVSFACFRGPAEAATQPIELWRSRDEGRTFERVPGRLDGSLASFRIAVGAEGRWVASGVCPPGSFGSCTPAGVQVQRDAAAPPQPARAKRKTKPLGAPAATPSLADAALAVGFSIDGRVAYAVGRRTKTGRFGLFVSRDGGRSFEAEDLELGQLTSDDEGDDYVERSPGTRVEWLSAAEDGAVALSFVHYGRRTLVVTDERAKLLSSAAPPEERALLSASGLRAIAVAPKSRQIWESLDGGVTWDPAEALPVDLCPGDSACDVPVRCSPHACVIGHEFTRVGWGRSGRDDAPLLLPPPRPVRAARDRRVRTPIACTLDSAPFRALLGVTQGPGAHDAAIGSAAWYAIAEDPRDASVSVYHASKGRIETTRLLDPVPRPEEYASAVLDQIEGIAALRYRVPQAVPGKTNLTNVEVAWDNVLAGTRGRARLADGGPHVAGDYVAQPRFAAKAEPELVSIAAGGLYLRLHARSPQQPTLFFDGTRMDSIPSVKWPRDERFPARSEVVHTDDVHAPILLVGRGAAIVRARSEPSGWAFDAYATGMIDPAAFGLTQVQSIAYVGGRAGLHLELHDDAGALSRAWLFPFNGKGSVVGTPVPVPTQRALGDRPRTCDAEQRKRTPRVVAVAEAGTRHPVIVSDAALGPRTLITGYAVLHGSESEPCAAAFEAVSVPAEGGQAARESALIFPDDPEHSVMFRVAGERDDARIEYREMACRFDPTLEVPPEIHRVTGAAPN